MTCSPEHTRRFSTTWSICCRLRATAKYACQNGTLSQNIDVCMDASKKPSASCCEHTSETTLPNNSQPLPSEFPSSPRHPPPHPRASCEYLTWHGSRFSPPSSPRSFSNLFSTDPCKSRKQHLRKQKSSKHSLTAGA